MKKNLVLLVIFVVIIFVIGLAMSFSNESYLSTKTNQKINSEHSSLSTEDLGKKIIEVINSNFLQGEIKASLVDVVKESGLYKIKFKIGDQEREFEAYASPDGKLFFPDAIDLTQF